MYDFKDLKPNNEYKLDIPSEAMSFKDEAGFFVCLEELILGYQTLQVTGRELLSYSVKEETPPGMDGALLESFNLPTRDISIKYSLKASDPKDFRKKFNKLMFYLSNQDLIFNFKDEPDYFFKGILSDADTPDGGQLEMASSFTIHCSSPWKFSKLYRLDVANGGVIKDDDLIYSVTPETISFASTAANFKFTNQTQNQTFSLGTAHSNVVLKPNTGEVTSDNKPILNDIGMFSELENLSIKNGDLIQITNGSKAVIQYRRWLL